MWAAQEMRARALEDRVAELQAALEEKKQLIAIWEARFDSWQNWRHDEILQAAESGIPPEQRAKDLARRRAALETSKRKLDE
jgi:hypothetical protein